MIWMIKKFPLSSSLFPSLRRINRWIYRKNGCLMELKWFLDRWYIKGTYQFGYGKQLFLNTGLLAIFICFNVLIRLSQYFDGSKFSSWRELFFSLSFGWYHKIWTEGKSNEINFIQNYHENWMNEWKRTNL